MLRRSIKTSYGNASSKLGRVWRRVIRCGRDGIYVYNGGKPHTNFCSQDTLTENNYRLFFGLALDVLIRPWEKLVLGQKYNEVPPLINCSILSAQICFFFFLSKSIPISLPSSVPSVSIAIYERSRGIFLRKPRLATCAKSSCDSSRSAPFSTSIMYVLIFLIREMTFYSVMLMVVWCSIRAM